MTTPQALIPNTTVLQRLLGRLPEAIVRDPVPVDALALVVSGASAPVVATVADGVLTIGSASTAVSPVSLELRDSTLSGLVDWFTANTTGYTVTLADSALAALRATVLIEGILDLNVDGGVVWPAFTSVLHALAMAWALALIDAHRDLDAALAQFDVRRATGQWIDLLGLVLGVPRLASEVGNDAAYRVRLLRERFEEKGNNRAIEYLLFTATGKRASVIDGGLPFLLADIARMGTMDAAAKTAYRASLSVLADIDSMVGMTSGEKDDYRATLYTLGPQSGAGTFLVDMLDALGTYTVGEIETLVTAWKAGGLTFTVRTAG